MRLFKITSASAGGWPRVKYIVARSISEALANGVKFDGRSIKVEELASDVLVVE